MTKITRPNEGTEYTNVGFINCTFLENEKDRIDPHKIIAMECWIGHYDEDEGKAIGGDYETVHKIALPYHTVDTRYLSIAPNDSDKHINISLEKEDTDGEYYKHYPADCKIFERKLRSGQFFRGLVCKSERQEYYDHRRILEMV